MSSFPANSARALVVALAAVAFPAVAQQQPTTRPAQPAQGQQRPAQGQQQQGAQQAPEQARPQTITGFSSGWARVCQQVQGGQGCIVSQEVFQEAGTFLASVAVQEIPNEPRKQIIVITPLGLALQGGVLLRVDQQNALIAKYGTCLQNGCFAGLDVGDDLLRAMRSGTNFVLTIRTAQGQPLDIAVPLQGFAAAVDGPPLEQAALQERQRRFQEEIVRRQEQTRREIQEQQRRQQEQGGATPPAPGAPVAPPNPASPRP